MTEKMDPYFAVFNNHINNAHKRAMEDLEVNSPEWIAEILAFEQQGIMGIFNEEPTPATLRYVELVTAFVNEGRED